ncbi:hypothetical protein [Rhizobium sp. BK538]|uniref:hypothetical protein n=1 Tax=Rhizobium sp. BK538 TaxID=2586984 RepID=UPI001AEEDD69|nr:hypothetical protein [Rhizobium sp. BK538]
MHSTASTALPNEADLAHGEKDDIAAAEARAKELPSTRHDHNQSEELTALVVWIESRIDLRQT